MSTTPDPREILGAWLAGSYVRADGQPVAGRAWDDDTIYRYTAALAEWPVYAPGQAPYDQSWFTYIGSRVWHFTADDIRTWADQLTNQDGTVMSEAARARAASAVRSFYKHCEDALGATSWRLPRRSQLVGPVPAKERELLSRDQMEALRSAADGYRGPMPERARLAVYLALAGLRPGQAIGLALLQIQRHVQNAPTWRLPAKNNSASATPRPSRSRCPSSGPSTPTSRSAPGSTRTPARRPGPSSPPGSAASPSPGSSAPSRPPTRSSPRTPPHWCPTSSPALPHRSRPDRSPRQRHPPAPDPRQNAARSGDTDNQLARSDY